MTLTRLDNPFTLTPDEVQALSNDTFVGLLNQLLHDRGLRCHIPIDQVRTTLRTNDADAGIDAIVDTGAVKDEFLGSGLSVWQFKKSFPTAHTKDGSKSELEKELVKAGVQEIFQRGGGYTLVVGVQRSPGGPHGQLKKLERLTELARHAGCRGQVRLFVADHVAAWTGQDPAVLLSFRPQLRGLVSVQSELTHPEHSAAFEPDAARTLILDDIGDKLFTEPAPSFHVRIHGQAGVGKTRLALEAVRRYGTPEATFYTASQVAPDLFDWVSAQPGTAVVLVADECEENEARRYAQWARQSGGRLKLITVGPGATKGPDIHILRPIDREAVERVIQAEAALPQERARWIAVKTRGFIKLAVLVARAIARGPTNVSDLSSDSDISQLVQKMLTRDDTSRRALHGIALLSRVGIEGDVANEGRTIAEFMGVDWRTMRHGLGQAIRQGIVVKRGRYWYVSPELLAIWLAGEVWSTQADRIVELLESLPSQAARLALHERLASLRDIPEVEEVVATLLGTAGPFRDLMSLEDEHTSRLFATLASGHDRAALGALTRLLSAASFDELQAFRRGRQQIVWVLHRLLERRETFFMAARLLRRLAEAENETYYSNNATDYWNKAFLTVLGQTEVPALERLPLIDEALAADSPTLRTLGVSALGTMLQFEEWATLNGPGETMPPEYWRPQTIGDLLPVKREALSRLVPLLGDKDIAVSAAARDVLRHIAPGMVDLGLTDELIAALQSLEPKSEEERRKTWEAIRRILRFERAHLSEKQRVELESLSALYFSDSLADRMKRYLGPGSLENWNEEDGRRMRPSSTAEQLADEAHQSSEWLTLLPWLFSGGAHNLYPFARRLGERDAVRRWFNVLSEAAVGSTDPRLLSGYLAGRAAVDPSEQEWRECLLDRWANDPTRAELVGDATLRGQPSDRAVERLFSLIRQGTLQPSYLGWLRTGNWITALSEETTIAIIEHLLQDGAPEAIASGLSIVASCVEHSGPSLPESLEAVGWRLLESPGGWSSGSHSDYLWREVAEPLVKRNPLRVVSLIARIYDESDPPFGDERLTLLQSAAGKAPRETLERLTPALMGSTQRFRLHWALKDLGFFAALDPSIVEEWVARHGVQAAEAVAESFQVPAADLPQVIRFLLINYGAHVDGILAGGVISGTWTGSEVQYLEPKLQAARRWAHDPELAVRQWALSLGDYLESAIAHARQREAEEMWR